MDPDRQAVRLEWITAMASLAALLLAAAFLAVGGQLSRWVVLLWHAGYDGCRCLDCLPALHQDRTISIPYLGYGEPIALALHAAIGSFLLFALAIFGGPLFRCLAACRKHDTSRCALCRYPRAGLPENVPCPECGHAREATRVATRPPVEHR